MSRKDFIAGYMADRKLAGKSAAKKTAEWVEKYDPYIGKREIYVIKGDPSDDYPEEYVGVYEVDDGEYGWEHMQYDDFASDYAAEYGFSTFNKAKKDAEKWLKSNGLM